MDLTLEIISLIIVIKTPLKRLQRILGVILIGLVSTSFVNAEILTLSGNHVQDQKKIFLNNIITG